jgi:thymidylate synthase
LLKKRGNFLIQNKDKKVAAIDEKINQLKKSNPESFTRPCHAFIIFETEEGKLRCLRMQKKLNVRLH